MVPVPRGGAVIGGAVKGVPGNCGIILYVGAWRSPVARLLWEQEVAGSNPVAPIVVSPAERKT